MKVDDRIGAAAAALAVFAEKNGIRQITATDDGQIIGRSFDGRQVRVSHELRPDILDPAVALAAMALARKHGAFAPPPPATVQWNLGNPGPFGQTLTITTV